MHAWMLALGRVGHRKACCIFGLALLTLLRSSAPAAASSDVPAPPGMTPQVGEEACPIGTVSRGVETQSSGEVVRAPKKIAWDRAHGGPAARRAALRERLVGWPERLLTQRESLPAADRDFAQRLAYDTWRGLRALRDRESGLPLDFVRFGEKSVAVSESNIGDYASSSDIGLFLIAVAAAEQLGVETHAVAAEMMRQVLSTLDGLERYEGFFYNYYDTTSLERTSNLISFVDSSWLTAGLIVARQTFPELAASVGRFLEQEDYRVFYDPKFQLMSHGYYVHPGRQSPFHYGVLYTEARLGNLIGIGKGDVPEAAWFSMVRTYPAACSWQSLAPKAARRELVRGHSVLTGYYEWRGVRFVPSWGGSMFEALMPTLLVDELRHAPESLGANDVAHVAVQQRYAREELNDPVWGQSPASNPNADRYSEYGIPVLGARGYSPGAVTPHASALALAVAPEAALSNLRGLAERYDIYGDFGFYDAVDPKSGAVAHKYMALDQAMIFVALANYLNPHCIQQSFAADPIVQKALPVLTGERFLE